MKKHTLQPFWHGIFFTSISIGIVMRLIALLNKPLWLDEIYSFLFATQYTGFELLFQLPGEPHPGLYYFILKVTLAFTSNHFFTRIITSLLPHLVGLSILFWSLYRIGISLPRRSLLASVFFLNPLFIEISWQLRMYSLATLFAATALSFFLLYRKKPQKKIYLVGLMVTCILGNATLYPFLFLSFGFLLFFAFTADNMLKKILLFIGGSGALLMQTILHLGIMLFPNLEIKIAAANWIPQPSLETLVQVYTTLLGINDDFFTLEKLPLWATLLFFVGLSSIFLRRKKIFFPCKEREFFIIGILPFIVLILVSLASEFLSHRFFFHQFVPSISFMIARAHLPLLFPLFVFTFMYLKPKWIHRNAALLIVGTYLSSYLLVYSPLPTQDQVVFVQEIQLVPNGNQTLLWPSWIALEKNKSFSDKEYFEKTLNQVENSENEIPFTDLSNICQQLEFPKTIYVKEKVVPALKDYQIELQETLDTCCNSKHLEAFTVYSCE